VTGREHEKHTRQKDIARKAQNGYGWMVKLSENLAEN
jgi:hypothetical protein